ncbi:hypothetical protein H4CHR_02921 [Variovorax sp. PBS-H4]|uniref:hypothetical protein n=1 Tax=Variovorax sp. PBS-H4 TaxID=434008 RepID=UPI001315DC9A|nr:hypothetical protein [Variovorax sp. PBS-H4]VTU31999.1 hypothetical protein H4CHR_02921 [Variovorax sp. PBS-H4]
MSKIWKDTLSVQELDAYPDDQDVVVPLMLLRDVRLVLADLADYAESATLENDPLPPCVIEAHALLNATEPAEED